MSEALSPALARTLEETCVCVGLQRVTRIIGRHYDAALKPVGLSNWQFAVLLRLCRTEAVGIRELSDELGMDRTTLTASLKTLERRGLVTTQPDQDDRRVRRPELTSAGYTLLAEALPLWRAAQAASAALVDVEDAAALHRTALALGTLSAKVEAAAS